MKVEPTKTYKKWYKTLYFDIPETNESEDCDACGLPQEGFIDLDQERLGGNSYTGNIEYSSGVGYPSGGWDKPGKQICVLNVLKK